MTNNDIYPKDFRSLRIPTEKNRCFILMPINDHFDNIYGNLKKTLHDNGYICNRADEILGSKPIMNKILNEILRSQFIIADLTAQNPNVFYELGVAHTFKDAQNIILITQKVEDIPFDIRHINNIVYEPSNIKYLTSNIIQTLKDNKYLMGFYEALQQRNIINIIHDNKEEFVDYLQQRLGDLIPIASNILSGNIADLKSVETEQYFNKLMNIIDDIFVSNQWQFANGVMKVLFESLVICSKYNITDKIVYDLLYGDLITSYNIDKSDLISYQTDLAIALASHKTKINSAMGWIINYFSLSKSATIDLNRYKVERFLMITNDQTINDIIIDSIFHENCYIREHLSDIVGEKKLFEASQSLLRQLVIEDNYFTAISIISAIGKLEVEEGAIHISNWIEEHSENIIKANQLFVLKHAHIALSRLDKKYDTNYLKQFDNKYSKYINNYFIL